MVEIKQARAYRSSDSVDYIFGSSWNMNHFIILPETFSQNVVHAPYRDETQTNLLLHKELKALT